MAEQSSNFQISNHGSSKVFTGYRVREGLVSQTEKSDGHNHGDYLIGTHREAATTNPNCTRLYIREGSTYGNKIAQTTKARAARMRFSTVSAAVKARRESVSTLTTDQAAFKAQKDLPNGKKTFKAYLWKICGEAYDEQYGG
jgi:hypothetical protein